MDKNTHPYVWGRATALWSDIEKINAFYRLESLRTYENDLEACINRRNPALERQAEFIVLLDLYGHLSWTRCKTNGLEGRMNMGDYHIATSRLSKVKADLINLAQDFMAAHPIHANRLTKVVTLNNWEVANA